MAETRKPLIVHSNAPHPLVGDNAYLQTNGIDLYAAAPLVLGDGTCAGALALLDYEKRDFTPEDVARLEAAAEDLVRRFGGDTARAA